MAGGEDLFARGVLGEAFAHEFADAAIVASFCLD
jgi:hypothetical protein